MNPQYPSGNGYDFILNSDRPSRRFSLPVGGRGGMIGVGVAAFLLVIFIFYSIFNSGGSSNAGAVSVVQTQQEIVRVATEAGPNTTQLSTSSLAINLQLTLQTQQNNLLAYLKTQGQKVSAKVLALKQNGATDQQLTTAQQNSMYDVAYAQIAQNELQAYESLLKTTYTAATGKNERLLLATDYAQAELLLKQVPSSQSLQE